MTNSNAIKLLAAIYGISAEPIENDQFVVTCDALPPSNVKREVFIASDGLDHQQALTQGLFRRALIIKPVHLLMLTAVHVDDDLRESFE
jgi:hypothetical protein